MGSPLPGILYSSTWWAFHLIPRKAGWTKTLPTASNELSRQVTCRTYDCCNTLLFIHQPGLFSGSPLPPQSMNNTISRNDLLRKGEVICLDHLSWDINNLEARAEMGWEGEKADYNLPHHATHHSTPPLPGWNQTASLVFSGNLTPTRELKVVVVFVLFKCMTNL